MFVIRIIVKLDGVFDVKKVFVFLIPVNLSAFADKVKLMWCRCCLSWDREKERKRIGESAESNRVVDGHGSQLFIKHRNSEQGSVTRLHTHTNGCMTDRRKKKERLQLFHCARTNAL